MESPLTNTEKTIESIFSLLLPCDKYNVIHEWGQSFKLNIEEKDIKENFQKIFPMLSTKNKQEINKLITGLEEIVFKVLTKTLKAETSIIAWNIFRMLAPVKEEGDLNLWVNKSNAYENYHEILGPNGLANPNIKEAGQRSLIHRLFDIFKESSGKDKEIIKGKATQLLKNPSIGKLFDEQELTDLTKLLNS
ncbi:MAG: hypothetical protein LBH38_00685 [Holosporales bacterium]|nr:hypothetical protein [Holosporales bacterium]